MKLGAEKWVDFVESKNIIQDVQQAADGVGPHAAVVAVGHVCLSEPCYLDVPSLTSTFISHYHSTKHSCTCASLELLSPSECPVLLVTGR